MTHTAQQTPPALLRTPLWQLHKDAGGKMVPFAGYEMPVQYEGMGVLKEHLHTRAAAGLFDVSHMGQAFLTDENDPALLLEKIVPGDIVGLESGKIRYTVLLNEAGGVIDDLMVTRWDEKALFIIVNAACKDKDFAALQKKIAQGGNRAKLKYLSDRALLALQGPAAEKVMARLIPATASMLFMTSLRLPFEGHEIYISRSGYTGEDGYEVSVPAGFAAAFANKLLGHEEVRWIGLGARDSLRLEAGLCLYGHDLDEETTPVESNLKWVIPKRRREEGGFPGAEKILAQLKSGTAKLRVGIKPEGQAPIREGTELLSQDGRKIGVITSGGFGPSAGGPVAMGYVESSFAATGTKLQAVLRGTPRICEVAALPFIKPNYKRD